MCRVNIAVLLFVFTFLLPSCSTRNFSTESIIKDIPQPGLTNMSSALDALNKKIEQEKLDSTLKVLVLIENIIDGSVRKASVSDGPLFDRSEEDLKSVLARYAPDSMIIPYYTPQPLVDLTTGQIQPVAYKTMLQNYGVDRIIWVKGVYCKNEASKTNQRSAGSDVYNNGNDAGGDISIGAAKNSKSVGLILTVGDPRTNTIITSVNLEVSIIDKSLSLSMSGDNDETSIGISYDSIIVEDIHSAQRTLVEAAAFWLIGSIYSETDYRQCLYQNEKHENFASAYHTYKTKSDKEKILVIQKILQKNKYLDLSHLNGKLDSFTKDSLASFLLDKGYYLPVQIDDNHLDNLYRLCSMYTSTE